MDSEVDALDDLLSSLEQMNNAPTEAPPMPPSESPRKMTNLGEKKGLGVKVVATEPNMFGVRLRKVNASELSPSAAAHASIAGEAPLASQIPTYNAAPHKVAAPVETRSPVVKQVSPGPGPAAQHARPPPPPTLRGGDGRDDVDRYLDSLSQQLDLDGARDTKKDPRGTRKFMDYSDALGSEFAQGDTLDMGLPPPPRPFTIPPIPAEDLKRQLAELDDEGPPQPLGRQQKGTSVRAAGPVSAFPPGVGADEPIARPRSQSRTEVAPVSRLPPRPAWSLLHADLAYTPNTGTVGVYGITYCGTWQPVGTSGQKVAIKRFKFHDLSPAFVAQFEEEVPRLVALNHPNLLPLLGVCLQDWNFSVFQWHSGQTLAGYLERTPRPAPEVALQIAKEIALGVEELHECGVVHGSLRPSNVMLDQQLHVRLADYGFEYVKREVRRTGQTLGCEYNAPEQLEHGPAYSTADAVDVYSICIIVNQLWSGTSPFPGILPRVVVAGVAQSAMRPQLAATLPAALRRTVQAGWSQEPARRPSFATIVSILSSPPHKLLA